MQLLQHLKRNLIKQAQNNNKTTLTPHKKERKREKKQLKVA